MRYGPTSRGIRSDDCVDDARHRGRHTVTACEARNRPRVSVTAYMEPFRVRLNCTTPCSGSRAGLRGCIAVRAEKGTAGTVQRNNSRVLATCRTRSRPTIAGVQLCETCGFLDSTCRRSPPHTGRSAPRLGPFGGRQQSTSEAASAYGHAGSAWWWGERDPMSDRSNSVQWWFIAALLDPAQARPHGPLGPGVSSLAAAFHRIPSGPPWRTNLGQIWRPAVTRW